MELIQQYLDVHQPKKAKTIYGTDGLSAGYFNDGIREKNFGYTSMSYNVTRPEQPLFTGRMASGPDTMIPGPTTVEISMSILLDDNDIYNALHFNNRKPIILKTEKFTSTVSIIHTDYSRNVGGDIYAHVTFRATDDFQLL